MKSKAFTMRRRRCCGTTGASATSCRLKATWLDHISHNPRLPENQHLPNATKRSALVPTEGTLEVSKQKQEPFKS